MNWRHDMKAGTLEVCNATHHLGEELYLIFRQRARGPVRAMRAIRNTWLFLTEIRFVADVFPRLLYC
jgi:hypothetical protein